MEETTAHPTRLGDDRVIRKGEEVLVHTNVDMPDWVVRSYRRLAIIFEGRKYFVADSGVSTYRKIRYRLEPWPDDFQDLPGKIVYYDEEYVAARDRALKEERKLRVLSRFLLPLTPVIGFLPSSTKLRLEANCGIPARNATWQSFWLELLLFFAHGVSGFALTFANLYMLAGSAGFVGIALLSYLLGMTVLLLIDVVMRYDSLLSDAISPYGFCEWLVKRRKR